MKHTADIKNKTPDKALDKTNQANKFEKGSVTQNNLKDKKMNNKNPLQKDISQK